MMQLVDTHCHLDDPRYDEDRQDVLRRAWSNNVAFLVNASSDVVSARQAVALAERDDRIFAAVGVHPHEASTYDQKAEALIRELARSSRVVAIGEIGLDYYYDNSPREIQRIVFAKQMELACELDMPIVIHSRDATQDTLDILREFAPKGARGIMHCFSGSYETAKILLDLGYYLAFGGSITFKNANRLREVVQKVPLDRILLETDCPYLTPVPHRGKRNEPAFVRYVAEMVAQVKEVDIETIAHVTTENAKRAFELSFVQVAGYVDCPNQEQNGY